MFCPSELSATANASLVGLPVMTAATLDVVISVPGDTACGAVLYVLLGQDVGAPPERNRASPPMKSSEFMIILPFFR